MDMTIPEALMAGQTENKRRRGEFLLRRVQKGDPDLFLLESVETNTASTSAYLPLTETTLHSADTRAARIASVAGICNEEPSWEDYMQAMAEYRREQDARDLELINE